MMTPSRYYEDTLHLCTEEDRRRFTAWTMHLPARNEFTPYHCGPHSIRTMEMAYKLAGRPKSVLEVGFCLGHSASIWLALGAKKVTSIENSTRPETLEAAKRMKEKHGGAFSVIEPQQAYPALVGYDLLFVDGGHEVNDVLRDGQTGLDLNIPWMLFDDYWPHWGPGVQPAIQTLKLKPIAVIGSMALCIKGDNWS